MENSLVRALVIGLAMAGGGIGLFLLLYFVIFAGSEALVKLLASLVIPPVVMFGLVGGYYILTQDESDSGENSIDDE